MTRLEANLKILELIKERIEKNHDLRFDQILMALKLDTPSFYRESTESLALLEKRLQELFG